MACGRKTAFTESDPAADARALRPAVAGALKHHLVSDLVHFEQMFDFGVGGWLVGWSQLELAGCCLADRCLGHSLKCNNTWRAAPTAPACCSVQQPWSCWTPVRLDPRPQFPTPLPKSEKQGKTSEVRGLWPPSAEAITNL